MNVSIFNVALEMHKGIRFHINSYTLARHAYNHGMTLDELFKFCILEHASPSVIHIKEHFWIQKLRTLSPIGLNSTDPFGISLLK